MSRCRFLVIGWKPFGESDWLQSCVLVSNLTSWEVCASLQSQDQHRCAPLLHAHQGIRGPGCWGCSRGGCRGEAIQSSPRVTPDSERCGRTSHHPSLCTSKSLLPTASVQFACGLLSCTVPTCDLVFLCYFHLRFIFIFINFCGFYCDGYIS